MPFSVQPAAVTSQQISEIQEVQANHHEPYGNTTDLINNFDTCNK